MKTKLYQFIISTQFTVLFLHSINVLADIQTDSNTIFDWAEKNYSSTLSPATTTKYTSFENASWYYRYYANSDFYLGVNQLAQIYTYHGSTQKMTFINNVSSLLEQINSSAATDTDPNGTETNSNSICNNYLNGFSKVLDLVAVSCTSDYLSIHSETGLPALKSNSGDDQIMVGITAWINRVPVPYDYNWLIPSNPSWQNNITEASAKGPIAVAINGVPIFHYERRPDVSTSLANYSSDNDTVVQGELDQCGGHSGQGDDYHYHYTPVCLLEEHDLSQPLAFGLDGAPVYYGEGGTDFYGMGQFNTWNNFPDGLSESSLDECNAYENTDGSYVHYTTKNPPYLIGCHHGFFDSALQIEPRPMSGREQGVTTPLGGEFGEPVSTLVNSFSLNNDGSYQMEFNALSANTGTSSVIYRKSSTLDNCWEFEFRVDKDQRGVIQTACRNNSSPTPVKRISAVHNHIH